MEGKNEWKLRKIDARVRREIAQKDCEVPRETEAPVWLTTLLL